MDTKNKNNPILSVIMPVYEGEEFLEETLNCVLNQSFMDFEFVILDNQSQDNSQKIIKSFQARDKRIKYIYDTKKRNGNDCFSELIKYVSGKYLIILNDDNYLDNNFFKKIFEKIHNTQSDLVVCNGWYTDVFRRNKKKFYKKKTYFKGKPSIYKIIKFFIKGDVIPLLLPTIVLRETFKKMLPYINLSKFENDADTLMGVKILSNLKIEAHDETLFFCRVYDSHVRYHDSNHKIGLFFKYDIFEKIKHDLNLLSHCIKEIYLSKISFFSKIILIIFFPFLLIIKRLKNIIYENIVKLKNFI